MAMPDSNEILSIGGGSVLLHDALGSTVGGVGSSGSLVFQYSYDPYGNFSATGTPPSGYGNVYAMAGMENDPSGLYHANARYYSPALTRFLSEDPERGKAKMFTYAGENAINGSDLSGMGDCGADCDEDDTGGGAGVGNPAAGFIEEIAPILNWIFNSNQQPSAATQTIAYSTDVQLKAQAGNSRYSTGTDGNQDLYTPQGNIFLIAEGDEDEPVEKPNNDPAENYGLPKPIWGGAHPRGPANFDEFVFMRGVMNGFNQGRTEEIMQVKIRALRFRPEAGWQKMQQVFATPEGNVVIHYFENANTGERTQFHFVSPALYYAPGYSF